MIKNKTSCVYILMIMIRKFVKISNTKLYCCLRLTIQYALLNLLKLFHDSLLLILDTFSKILPIPKKKY